MNLARSEMYKLRLLRSSLIKKQEKVLARRAGPGKELLRARLDACLLAFRVARREISALPAAESGSWLRSVRQAMGIPVEEVARRLEVCKWEVLRLEKAERTKRIGVASLQRAAEALDCELVYALVPHEGTLEDLALEQEFALEEAREAAREENAKGVEEIEEAIDWHAAMRRQIRRGLRERGMRVR